MDYNEYKKWASKYDKSDSFRKKEDYCLNKKLDERHQLTADEIAQIFTSDYNKQQESKDNDCFDLDALLVALNDDYDRTMPEEEWEFEKAYRRGWNDAIDHIAEILKYEFKRR